MGNVIQTNVSSLNAQRNLTRTNISLGETFQRLSSGFRINSAKDDAAGLQIANQLSSQVRGLTVSVYGDELPIFDGSSEFWIDALLDSDFKVSYDSLPVKAIDQPVIFREKQSVYEFLPHDKDELIIDCCYRPFEDGLYEQSYSYKHSPEAFSIEIAAAKTFCFAKDIDKLK